MIAFLKCVGEAFVEQGLRGLAGMVPGGPYALKVAESAFQKYRKNRNDQAIRDGIQQLAQQSFDEAKQAAEDVAREVAGQAPIEDRIKLELVLAQIPANVRQTLKRADDPSGKTVPAGFQLRSADDVVNLIPARSPRFTPGTTLPKREAWILERQIGIGGFGEVWLAVHRQIRKEQLAVKFGRDADADRDLVNERDIILRLMDANPHSSLVPLKDVEFGGDIPWLGYEYVNGGDLADLIRVLQALPQYQRLIRATAAFRELVEAVAELHKQNIVHRDLKPSNILIEANTQRLRVTDFGISGLSAKKDLRDELAGTTTRAGRIMSGLRGSHTALYASPQQKDPNNNPDPRDDVHALGVIGYQLFTGHLTQGAGPDMAEDLKDAGVNADLVELIKQCVSQKQERRPENAGAMLARLPAGEPDTVPLTVAASRKTPSAATPATARVIVAEQVPPSVLPPLPKDILELEGKVASLELTISEIEKGTHPNLRDAADSLRARGVSIEAVIQRLKPDIDAHPNRSAADLCRLFPDVPTTALMPVIASLQRRVELAKELGTETQRLIGLQTADFHQLLENALAPAPGKAFPLMAWNQITEHVEVRRYRFAKSSVELLTLAEKHYRERLEELQLEERAKSLTDVTVMQQYVSRYPKGRFVKFVGDRLAELLGREQAEREEQQRHTARQQAVAADARATKLRNELLRDITDRSARRAYLAARTEKLKQLDANSSWAWHPYYLFTSLCLVLPCVLFHAEYSYRQGGVANAMSGTSFVFFSIACGTLAALPIFLLALLGFKDKSQSMWFLVGVALLFTLATSVVMNGSVAMLLGRQYVWLVLCISVAVTPLAAILTGYIMRVLNSSDSVDFFSEYLGDPSVKASFVGSAILLLAIGLAWLLAWSWPTRNLESTIEITCLCIVGMANIAPIVFRLGISSVSREYGPLPFWQWRSKVTVKKKYL